MPAGLVRQPALSAFAVTGTVLPLCLTHQVFPLTWWNRPWPWSQLVFEFGVIWFILLAASPILIAGLLQQRKFRWIALFRTFLFAQPLLLTFPHLATLLPAYARPIRAATNLGDALLVTIWFLVLLASAWLGCRSPHRALKWKQEHS